MDAEKSVGCSWSPKLKEVGTRCMMTGKEGDRIDSSMEKGGSHSSAALRRASVCQGLAAVRCMSPLRCLATARIDGAPPWCRMPSLTTRALNCCWIAECVLFANAGRRRSRGVRIMSHDMSRGGRVSGVCAARVVPATCVYVLGFAGVGLVLSVWACVDCVVRVASLVFTSSSLERIVEMPGVSVLVLGHCTSAATIARMVCHCSTGTEQSLADLDFGSLTS
jgi:hypothetical protein